MSQSSRILTTWITHSRPSEAEDARCWRLRCRGRKSRLFFRLAAFRECAKPARGDAFCVRRYLFWHRKSRTARVGFAWGEIQAFPATRHDCNVSYRVGKVTSGGNPQPWPQVKNRTRNLHMVCYLRYFAWCRGTIRLALQNFSAPRGTDNSLAIATTVANHFAGP